MTAIPPGSSGPALETTVLATMVGEIVTRGYHVMMGYFDDPAATREAIERPGLAAHR